jgi:hypothetical protein
LNDLTGDPRPQPEEVIRESFDRNHDEASATLQRLTNQLDSIPIVLQLLPVWRAFQGSNST